MGNDELDEADAVAGAVTIRPPTTPSSSPL